MAELTQNEKHERLALKIDPERKRLWRKEAKPAWVHTSLGEKYDWLAIDFTSASGFWPLWEWFRGETHRTLGHTYVRYKRAWAKINERFNRIGINGYSAADFRREAFELIFNAVFPSEGE